jgi:hypothetical protein
MRLLFLAAAFGLAATTASADVPNARAAYAERRGLIEADTQCRLFTPSIRSALQVGAAQARGALLRSGWTGAQMRSLESAAVNAARARACNDERTTTAAADARRAFTMWVNAGTMEFPGWERLWIARRAVTSDPAWRLSQAIDGPVAAVFGVRQRGEAQRLTLIVPAAIGGNAATSATLILRDASRASVQEISLTQRMSYGLEAGLAAPNARRSVPSTRTAERVDGRTQAVFTFPDTAFRDLMALDPRETVELSVVTNRGTQRLFVEVGDVSAARAFLTIR